MEQTLLPRLVRLTTRNGIQVRRTLPDREIRTIGAWCFVDDYGPTHDESAMSVAAHPHAGLQTVTWLFSGEVEHRDSLGSVQLIHPGELNIMSAGRGISHSELSLSTHSQLHGVQLWTVLPDQYRNIEPRFDHYQDLPNFEHNGLAIRLFVGEFGGAKAQTQIYSPLVGVEMVAPKDYENSVELNQEFEHGILAISGDLVVNGSPVAPGNLHYISAGAHNINLVSDKGSKFLLLGGAPFTEEIIMWWNFIARTQEEIEELREKWNSRSADFPSFADHIGGWIPAPAMPNIRLSPRGPRGHAR